MKARIEIDMDNDAFVNNGGEPDAGPELARILRELADSIEDLSLNTDPENYFRELHDAYGNKVGTFKVRR